MLHKAKLHKVNSHLAVAGLLIGMATVPALAQNTTGGATTGAAGGNMGGSGMAGAGMAGGAMTGSGAAGGAMSGGMSHNSMLAMQIGQAMASAMDDLFIMKAAQGNLAEVTLGQLALRKTRNAQVRQLAQRLVQDHTTANTELAQVFVRRGQTMPRQVGVMHQATQEQLSRLSGNRFDQTFMAGQVEAHENTITLYQTELAQGRDEGARSYASRYLPAILEHTAMIYSLARAVRAPGIELRPQALTTQSLMGGTATGSTMTDGTTAGVAATMGNASTGTSGGSTFITSGGVATTAGAGSTGGGAAGTGTAGGSTTGGGGSGAAGGGASDTGGTSNTGSGSSGSQGATGGTR
jgi:putative membrane protein